MRSKKLIVRFRMTFDLFYVAFTTKPMLVYILDGGNSTTIRETYVQRSLRGEQSERIEIHHLFSHSLNIILHYFKCNE